MFSGTTPCANKATGTRTTWFLLLHFMNTWSQKSRDVSFCCVRPLHRCCALLVMYSRWHEKRLIFGCRVKLIGLYWCSLSACTWVFIKFWALQHRWPCIIAGRNVFYRTHTAFAQHLVILRRCLVVIYRLTFAKEVCCRFWPFSLKTYTSPTRN